MTRIALALLAACTKSSDPTPTTLEITPNSANVLTCGTQQFTANEPVTWTAEPGGIDANGLYSAAASPGPAAVTANGTATAEVTLATAFPGPAVPIAGSAGSTRVGTMGAYGHDTAARGDRAYAIWPVNPAGGTTVAVEVARSDDGGTTWGAPVSAIGAAIEDGMDTSQVWAECAAIAIDAMDPDVVYAVARISGGNSLGAAVEHPDDATLVYAVSTDGGATFATSVLRATTGVGVCADLSSPVRDHVVVVDPVDDCAEHKDAYVFGDAHRGAAFATGSNGTGEYLANGSLDGLDSLDGRACDDPARIDVESDGTTAGGGEASEQPRMFANGAGEACIAYIAASNGEPGTPEHAYVQCTTSDGDAFSAPEDLDADAPAGTAHNSATGAFAPSGKAAVVFMRGDGTHGVFPYLATSQGPGTAFDAAQPVPTYMDLPAVNPAIAYTPDGVLWLAYRVEIAEVDTVVVDKSCDDGATWSGPVVVETEAKWPSLLVGSDAAPRLAVSAPDHLAVHALAP